MKRLLKFLFLFSSSGLTAQDSITIPRSSVLFGLSNGDSVTFYQCRVIDPDKEEKIASDYAQPARGLFSITDKIVLMKRNGSYSARVYSTHIRDLPNRKFSGLKMKERPYWMFGYVRTGTVPPAVLKFLLRLESSGREAIEYDYALTKHTRNQVIIKRGKNFKQILPSINTRLVDLVK